MEDEKLLKEIRDNLRLAVDAEAENRKNYLADVTFENGDQWNEAAKKKREGRKQPCLVINTVGGVVKQIINDAKQNKIAIKVRPVDDVTDPKTAEIFNGLIRNIEQASGAEAIYDNALTHAVKGGWGYIRVTTNYADDSAFDQDIQLERVINPLSVYLDPAAVKADRSDAKWCLILDTMDKETYKKEYPNSRAAGDLAHGEGDQARDWIATDTVTVGEYFRVSGKKDTLCLLADGRTVRASDADNVVEVKGGAVKTKKIFPAMVYEVAAEIKDGKILVIGGEVFPVTRERDIQRQEIEWYKTNGLETLEGPKKWAGKYIPIVFVAGDETWIEGKPVLRSAIHFAKDPAMLYNWARSTSVTTMAMSAQQPYVLSKDEIAGFEEMWEDPTNPLPYRLFNDSGRGRPQKQAGSTPDLGAQQEAMLASDDIKRVTGIFDASLGNKSQATSGVQEIALQRKGDNANYHFIDNLANISIRHLGRILIDLIPAIYDTERVVRLLNVDGSEGWEKINQEIVDPVTGKKNKINDISVGKFDVVCSVGPAYGTKRIEAAAGMQAFLTMAPMYAPIVAPRMAKNLDWPEAEEMAGEMKAMANPAPPNPMAEMAMQDKALTMQGKELTNRKKEQDLAQGQAEQDERTKALIVEALIGAGLIR